MNKSLLGCFMVFVWLLSPFPVILYSEKHMLWHEEEAVLSKGGQVWAQHKACSTGRSAM